jgi:hypothetical protein
MPDIKRYFEEIEIKKAENDREKTIQSQFPLVFKVVPLFQNQYSTALTMKAINELQLSGVIQINENAQRESEITVFDGQLISHVSYNDNKSREIAESLLNRKYWVDPIKWNLIDDISAEYDYDQDEDTVTIRKGSIALIDGQHRTRAIEYALIQDPSLEYRFPILLTIGTIREAQDNINQHEKQSPINKHKIKTYQASVENNIFRKFETNEEIREIYKFADTIQALQAKAGFILKADMIDAINTYYKVSDFSKKEQNDLAKWLVDFFLEIGDIFENDFKNFRNISDSRWSVNRFVFIAYVGLSSIFYNYENWKLKLHNLLDDFDFSNNNKPWISGASKPDKSIISKFKEVLKNEH